MVAKNPSVTGFVHVPKGPYAAFLYLVVGTETLSGPKYLPPHDHSALTPGTGGTFGDGRAT
jgi:hypothetical protein